MPVPLVDNNHSAEALAYVTQQFKNATNMQGILKSLMVSVQELEGVYWDIINKRLLNNQTAGDQLDQIGAIVGQPRLGMVDSDYRNAISVRIRANRSQGRAEDIIQIVELLNPTAQDYKEYYPASWTITAYGVPVTSTIVSLLQEAKAPGTYGTFISSTGPFADAFIMGSVYTSVPGANLAFSDTYSSYAGGNMQDVRIV